jgi:hypothetical protein
MHCDEIAGGRASRKMIGPICFGAAFIGRSADPPFSNSLRKNARGNTMIAHPVSWFGQRA